MKVHSVTDKVRFIESVFGKSYLSRNGNLDVKCPFCDPKDPTKKKLSIRITDDANHCWTCGFRARSLIPLLRKFARIEKIQEYIDTFLPDHVADRHKFCSVDAEKVKVRASLPGDFKFLATSDLKDPDEKAVKNYLVNRRGFTERDLWFHKIGTSNQSKWYRRAIMPSFDANGELNFIVGRAVDDWRKPKYDACEVPKNDIVFNEINIDWSREVVLVEGAFDAAKCPENTVPVLGSTMSESSLLFNRIVTNGTPIVIMFDADTMTSKTPSLAKQLQRYDVEVKIADMSFMGKHDPGELSKKEVLQLLETSYVPDWNSWFNVKLNNVVAMKL
jgi:hypothetical protein